MKQIPTMQFLRFYRADHYRIAKRLKFDHMVFRANSPARQYLFAVNRIGWAREELRLLRDRTEFRHDAVYFICTCMQLESIVQALTERKPQPFSLSLVVGGVGFMKIREKFLRQTKQIYVQPCHSHEDCLQLK
jgi:hypothetical protein